LQLALKSNKIRFNALKSLQAESSSKGFEGWGTKSSKVHKFAKFLILSHMALSLFAVPAFAHGGGGGFGGGGGRGGGGWGRGGWGSRSGGSGPGHYGVAPVHGYQFGMYGRHLTVWSPQPYWYQWNQSWGSWGAWARPYHWNSWYSGWAGWGSPWLSPGLAFPMYFNSANMPSPLNLNAGELKNVNVNEVSAQILNESGSFPPPRHYHYREDLVDNFVVPLPIKNSQSTSSPPAGFVGTEGEAAQTKVMTPSVTPRSAVEDFTSAIQLGPDADILEDGKVAIYLTENAFMLVNNRGSQIVDQESGRPILSLYTDPSLLWQIQAEVKRQSNLLQFLVRALKQSVSEESNATASQKEEDFRRAKKLQGLLNLLNKSAMNLGEINIESRPSPQQPPIAGAIEILSSVWMLPRSKFIVMRLQDSSLAYMDNSSLYSDKGKTKLALPYPASFKAAVEAYLQTLVRDADTTRKGLEHDQLAAQSLKSSFKTELKVMSPGGSPPSLSLQNTKGLTAIDETQRLQIALERTTKRLDAINKQLDEMPKELNAAKLLLKSWQ